MSAEAFLARITKINMLNIVVFCVLFIWGLGSCKGLFSKIPLTQDAKEINTQLKDVMLIVLGFYLKQTMQKLADNTTNKNNDNE